MIERPSFAVAFDMWRGSREAWITILISCEHAREWRLESAPLKEIADARERRFLSRKSVVSPRREKVVENDDGLNSRMRSDRTENDRSIRHAVDTKSSHVSITRTRRHHTMRSASSRHPVTMRPLTPTKTLRVRPQTRLQAGQLVEPLRITRRRGTRTSEYTRSNL